MPREKQDTVPLMVRLPPDIHAALQKAAVAEDRSLNAQIVAILRAALTKVTRRK